MVCLEKVRRRRERVLSNIKWSKTCPISRHNVWKVQVYYLTLLATHTVFWLTLVICLYNLTIYRLSKKRRHCMRISKCKRKGQYRLSSHILGKKSILFLFIYYSKYTQKHNKNYKMITHVICALTELIRLPVPEFGFGN